MVPGRRVAGRTAGLAATLILLGMMAGAGCGAKKERRPQQANVPGEPKEVVEEGDRVRVAFTGKLADGTVFDQTPPDQPFEFVVGGGEAIHGLDRAVVGMKVGEEKTVTIRAEDAYGLRDEEKVARLLRDQLPEGYEPEKGMGLGIVDRMGRPVPGTIVAVGGDTIVVDLNHPLAGRDLTLDIKVVAAWRPRP